MRVTRYSLYSSTQSLCADSGYTHVFFRVPRCSQSRLCMSSLPPCLWEDLQFHWLSLSESMLHIGTQQSIWHPKIGPAGIILDSQLMWKIIIWCAYLPSAQWPVDVIKWCSRKNSEILRGSNAQVKNHVDIGETLLSPSEFKETVQNVNYGLLSTFRHLLFRRVTGHKLV